MDKTVKDELLELKGNEYNSLLINSANLVGEHKHPVNIVGIIGCGAIAKIITDYAVAGNLGVETNFFYDQNLKKAKKLAAQVDGVAVRDVKDMLGHVDLVVEAASPPAVVDLVPTVLQAGKDVMIMSLGALMDFHLKDYLEDLARQNNAHVYLPSGALAGLDGVRSAAVGEIMEVSLVTRKNPLSFGIKTDQETVLFEGKAGDAVRKFPANINVAAALSIACGREAEVKIIADPSVDYNCHQVHVVGDFGEIKTTTQNRSCVTNPKTSVLAAYSAIKLLKRFNQTLKVGT
ncbi:MAG: aspartate dehydrogenase [Methanobacteriaceae archaeon]|jgi:aspartate dehydrogenase|nr:aspartate dehydrogenase [Methanobacteriaceae archaeon]OPY29232.1 MAG: putative L-aspartate dehydrogenase [Methanobacterium sp. PtaU1.Bin242]